MTVEKGGRQILIHGMSLILAGLVWGLLVPTTPYPRLALGAHIQFETNGMLFMILGAVLLKLPHNVGSKSLRVMILAAWLTWGMALSEAANAWWGTTGILPIAAAQAGATGGTSWQEAIMKVTHMGGALALIAAWALLTVGFVRNGRSARSAD